MLSDKDETETSFVKPSVSALVGPRIVLRPLVPEDKNARQKLGVTNMLKSWDNDNPTRPMSDREAQEWFDRRIKENSPTRWMIDLQDKLIGRASLEIHPRETYRAKFAIGMFAPSYQHGGMAVEATAEVLRYGFTQLNLNRIELRVLAFNMSAIECYSQCGFKVEGRARQSYLYEGSWQDDLYMAILREEYLKQFSSPVLY